MESARLWGRDGEGIEGRERRDGVGGEGGTGGSRGAGTGEGKRMRGDESVAHGLKRGKGGESSACHIMN